MDASPLSWGCLDGKVSAQQFCSFARAYESKPILACKIHRIFGIGEALAVVFYRQEEFCGGGTNVDEHRLGLGVAFGISQGLLRDAVDGVFYRFGKFHISGVAVDGYFEVWRPFAHTSGVGFEGRRESKVSYEVHAEVGKHRPKFLPRLVQLEANFLHGLRLNLRLHTQPIEIVPNRIQTLHVGIVEFLRHVEAFAFTTFRQKAKHLSSSRFPPCNGLNSKAIHGKSCRTKYH